MKKIFVLFFISSLLLGCSSQECCVTPPDEAMYFPPNDGSNTWETKSVASLNWNQTQVQPLLDYLNSKNTKSFMIIVNGRIVMENYFNNHDANTLWYWAKRWKNAYLNCGWYCPR
jgi:hypothetical protein